jgi:TatD DNase family protein
MALEDIVLETDAPYLSPVPYRGKRNESSYIPIICEKIAQIKEVPVDQVAATTTASALRMLLPR